MDWQDGERFTCESRTSVNILFLIPIEKIKNGSRCSNVDIFHPIHGYGTFAEALTISPERKESWVGYHVKIIGKF